MRDSALKLPYPAPQSAGVAAVGEELMRDSALKLCGPRRRPGRGLPPVGEELMRDSALKLPHPRFLDITLLVGEELMRDSALKRCKGCPDPCR